MNVIPGTALPLRMSTVAVLMAAASLTAHAHRLVTGGNGKLAIVAADGSIEWEMPWGGIHDIHGLENGNIMVQEDMRRVVEIDPRAKKVVWSYDSAAMNGNAGKRVEVHAFEPLANGNVMIAESGPARIIEVNRDGKLVKEIPLRVDDPHPHRDARLVRKLSNGNYLVCHEGDGAVREYDGATGSVVWDFPVPLFGRERAPGHGHSVIEVTPGGEIVWTLEQDELPGIRFAWVTTIEVLPDGHYVIGNCHAGPDNPLVVEIEPKTKKVVWTFDGFKTFGNSAPNSQILDVDGEVIR